MTGIKEKVQTILSGLSPEERQLLGRVLKIEKENLYQQKPRGVKDDLMRAVKEIIK